MISKGRSNLISSDSKLPISINGLLCQAGNRKCLSEPKSWHSSCLVLSWMPPAPCKRQEQHIPHLSLDKEQQIQAVRRFNLDNCSKRQHRSSDDTAACTWHEPWGEEKPPAAGCCFLLFNAVTPTTTNPLPEGDPAAAAAATWLRWLCAARQSCSRLMERL